MAKFLIKWFINVIALLIVIHTIAGVSIDNLETVFIAALILGLFNTFIKPFILIATLPFTILTFGIFTFFINGFLFYLAAKFVKGFTVADFWSAFWAALLFSVVSSVLSFLFAPKITVKYDLFRSRAGGRQGAQRDDFIDAECRVEGESKDTYLPDWQAPVQCPKCMGSDTRFVEPHFEMSVYECNMCGCRFETEEAG